MYSDFTESCLADEMAARHCICAVLDRLRAVGLAPERAGDVELVLAEAINNVVEHAYDGQSDGEIKLRVKLDSEYLIIRVQDEGVPLPTGRIPAAQLGDPSIPNEDLPEGGFGWFLIRSLTSAVRYNREDACNQLSLYFEIRDDDLPALTGSQLP